MPKLRVGAFAVSLGGYGAGPDQSRDEPLARRSKWRAARHSTSSPTVPKSHSPVLLGRGDPLLAGLDLPALDDELTEHVTTDKATNVVFTRRS